MSADLKWGTIISSSEAAGLLLHHLAPRKQWRNGGIVTTVQKGKQGHSDCRRPQPGANPGHLGTWAVRISSATQWSSLAPVSRARSKSTKTNLGTLAFLVLLHSIPAINQNGDSPNKHYHQVILLTCWNVYKPICKLRKGIRGKQPFRQRQLPAMETPRRAPDKSITQ